jgi:hypothetical protein
MSSFRLLCLILLGSTLLASAQSRSPLVVKKIRYSFENAPEYVISGGSRPQSGNSSAQKWVLFEVEFDTLADWINEATVDMYVLIEATGQQPQNLQGTAIYQDISKGTSHKIALFMSPQTYKRYTGTSSQQSIKDVAVKVTIGGALADLYSDKYNRRSNRRWWEVVAPQPAVLRSINNTPWYPLYYNVYEQLKPGS